MGWARGKAWLRPPGHAGFLRPRPLRPGATPSSCRTAQRPHLARHSACCSLLSFRVSGGAGSPAPWMELARGFSVPAVPASASFTGFCRFSGRGCFPLTGDSLAWCWEQVGLLLFSPHAPPKMYEGLLTHSTPWGSRGHPLSQGP